MLNLRQKRKRLQISTFSNILFFIFFIFQYYLQISEASTIYEDYEECRDREKFGNVSLICDPEHKLQRNTLRRLDNLLRELQNKIVCECGNGCEREGGLSNKYIGLLLVTNTNKISESASNSNQTLAQTLTENAKKIYENSLLGNKNCDNGLVILYIKDLQKIATYRGEGHFALLDDQDMEKLHKLATSKSDSTNEDSMALKYLLGGFENGNKNNSDMQRAESWGPIVGLTVALVIILIILALLFSMLLAKLCCCCFKKQKRERKDKYYVTMNRPSYRNIEPIYIVSPPLSEHAGSRQDIRLYNSPYSAPLPPLPPTPIIRPPGHNGSNHRSRSLTPISNDRTRIQQPAHTSASTYASATQTPQANKSDKINRTSTTLSKHSNGTYYTSSVIVPPGSPQSPVDYETDEGQGPLALFHPHAGEAAQRRHQNNNNRQSQILEPIPSDGEPTFSFLDPHRKREVQTREEFIN